MFLVDRRFNAFKWLHFYLVFPCCFRVVHGPRMHWSNIRPAGRQAVAAGLESKNGRVGNYSSASIRGCKDVRPFEAVRMCCMLLEHVEENILLHLSTVFLVGYFGWTRNKQAICGACVISFPVGRDLVQVVWGHWRQACATTNTLVRFLLIKSWPKWCVDCWRLQLEHTKRLMVARCDSPDMLFTSHSFHRVQPCILEAPTT